MAEGLLHDFEGWFMFVLCLVLLVIEMVVLARLGGHPEPLRAVFGLEYPDPIPKGAAVRLRPFSAPMLAGGLLVAVAGATSLWGPAREQIHPKRTSFALFPMSLPGGWVGRPDHLDRDVIATLAVDDYIIANYTRAGEPWVNVYTAYYDNQSGGQSSHSPRTCIPGGGWEISQFDEAPVKLVMQSQAVGADATASANANASAASPILTVNRAVIQKGTQRQLVYYWFRQRGRVMTSELAVKWFILRDGITRERSDGALVRLVTPVPANEDIAQADRRLVTFLSTIDSRLRDHIPD